MDAFNPTATAQSLFDAITAAGQVPVVNDLTAAGSYVRLFEQWMAYLGANIGGGGGGGWTLQSAGNWDPTGNNVGNDAGPTNFPLGNPVGAISDVDTPDGTLFRFSFGGTVEQPPAVQTSFRPFFQLTSGILIPLGFLQLPNNTAMTALFSGQVNGRVLGSGAARSIVYNASIVGQHDAGLALLAQPAGADMAGDPTAYVPSLADDFNFASVLSVVNPSVIVRLGYMTMEYLLP